MSDYFMERLTPKKKGTFYLDGLTQITGVVEKVGVDYVEIFSGKVFCLIPLEKIIMFELELSR